MKLSFDRAVKIYDAGDTLNQLSKEQRQFISFYKHSFMASVNALAKILLKTAREEFPES